MTTKVSETIYVCLLCDKRIPLAGVRAYTAHCEERHPEMGRVEGDPPGFTFYLALSPDGALLDADGRKVALRQ